MSADLRSEDEDGEAERALTSFPPNIRKRDLKLKLETEIQKQVVNMLSETAKDMVSDIEIVEIEDILACDMEASQEHVQKYVVKVKLMASVYVPLILQSSSDLMDQEHAMTGKKDAPKESMDVVEAGACEEEVSGVRRCETFDESLHKTESHNLCEFQNIKMAEKNDTLHVHDGAIPNSSWFDSEELDVDDFESHNFDADRTEEKFVAGEVWALYDDKDGMPRNYAYIDKLCSITPFDVCISWLEPKVRTEEEANWLKLGNSITCGEYSLQKQLTHITYVECFSHVMKSKITKTGEILITPEQGEVWALYRAEIPPSGYDIVQIVSKELCTLTVVPLVKVHGFRTRFMQQPQPLTISMDNVSRFSHKIPACFLGQEVLGLDATCCLELDPASTP